MWRERMWCDACQKSLPEMWKRTHELLWGMQQLHKRKTHFVLNEQPIDSICLYMYTSMNGSIITNLVECDKLETE